MNLIFRKNRTLIDMLYFMLVNAKLSTSLWMEALLTACYIHNRNLSRKLKVSPYELWKKRKPNLINLKFGAALPFIEFQILKG